LTERSKMPPQLVETTLELDHVALEVAEH